MAELAWRVAEIRGEKAAANYARLETLATEGDFRAVERLDEMANASAWEIAPDAQQAEELHRMLGALEPTPLLPEQAESTPERTPGALQYSAPPSAAEAD